MNTQEPLVSICCITYNHENYIRDCIDGFLMQKTTFPIEIIIHDDASTDGTALIIKEYADKNPELFITILQKENQWSKVGGSIYGRFVYPRARGKYIAICEGDDYWIDPLKLQKQVDFLENNKEYVFCTHRYYRNIINSNELILDLYPFLFKNGDGIIITKRIFKKYWLTQPLTALIKADSLKKAIIYSNNYKYFRDINLFYFLLKQGDGFCMNFFGGVYNVHDGGIQSGLNTKEKKIANYLVIKELLEHFPNDSILKYKLYIIIISFLKEKPHTLGVKLIGDIHVTKIQQLRYYVELLFVIIMKYFCKIN